MICPTCLQSGRLATCHHYILIGKQAQGLTNKRFRTCLRFKSRIKTRLILTVYNVKGLFRFRTVIRAVFCRVMLVRPLFMGVEGIVLCINLGLKILLFG